ILVTNYQRILSGRKNMHYIEDNYINFAGEDARVKETQDTKDSEQMEASVESVDRISHLPDHVIHHILSHLRNVRDTIRTSVLSKRWRTLWYSFSVLIFDERKFSARIGYEDNNNKEKTFRDYVSLSIHNHVEKKLLIQKLVVHMINFDLNDIQYVDHWLNVAIIKNINELDLHVGKKNINNYTVPQNLFSSKTLTRMRISGCKLETCNNILLPHLQKVYLCKLILAEHVIENLIFSCYSIEDLRIIKCAGLKHLRVSNHVRLNRVEIYHCNQLKRIEINAPNLDTFWYCGKKTTPCKVSLEGCTSLKRLTLEHPQVIRDFYKNHISNFPVLERLDISMTNSMIKSIMISNPHLQKFSLKGCKKLKVVRINAPNLVTFECKGETMPWVEIHSSCLRDAKLYFVPKFKHEVFDFGDEIWFKMKSFIERFNHEGFKLVLYSNKNIVIHEDLNNITFPPVPDLGCEIIKSPTCIDDILCSLLQLLHPMTLSIISPLDSTFPKLVYETIKSRDKDPICCKYNTFNNKCWRHFLKDVNFEDLNDMKLEDIKVNEDKRTYTWYKWLKSDYTTLQCQMTNLRFKRKSVVVGPWGCNGGNSWDDGTLIGVREIKLVYDCCIDSIHVVYDKNDNIFRAENMEELEIKMKFSDEFLMNVSGHYWPVVRGGTA
ncbi:Jacalin-related lectin 19, partial [Mucuna pruriens]